MMSFPLVNLSTQQIEGGDPLSSRRRLREIVEWSGGASDRASPRNSRNVSESATRQAIPRSESNPFEVADQQQAEVQTRRHRRTAQPLRVIAPALLLHEAMLFKQPVQALIERVAGAAGQI